MATGNNNQATEWNNKIRKCLFTDITNIETNGGERICIVGDFNAHISETNDKEDKEGYELKAFCASKNLHILNTTEKCKGIRTWQRGTSGSCIDYALANSTAEKEISEMQIDEEGNHSLDSDHNLITLKWSYSTRYTKKKKKSKLSKQINTITIGTCQKKN